MNVAHIDSHGALWSKQDPGRSTMLAHGTNIKKCFLHPSAELLIVDTVRAVAPVKIRLENNSAWLQYIFTDWI